MRRECLFHKDLDSQSLENHIPEKSEEIYNKIKGWRLQTWLGWECARRSRDRILKFHPQHHRLEDRGETHKQQCEKAAAEKNQEAHMTMAAGVLPQPPRDPGDNFSTRNLDLNSCLTVHKLCVCVCVCTHTCTHTCAEQEHRTETEPGGRGGVCM